MRDNCVSRGVFVAFAEAENKFWTEVFPEIVSYDRVCLLQNSRER